MVKEFIWKMCGMLGLEDLNLKRFVFYWFPFTRKIIHLIYKAIHLSDLYRLHLMSLHSLTTLMNRPRENIVLILHSLIINPCSLLILIQFLKSDRLRFGIKSPSQNSDWLRNRADAAFHNCNSSTNSVLTKSSCLFNGFHGLRNAQYLFILWTNGMS